LRRAFSCAGLGFGGSLSFVMLPPKKPRFIRGSSRGSGGTEVPHSSNQPGWRVHRLRTPSLGAGFGRKALGPSGAVVLAFRSCSPCRFVGLGFPSSGKRFIRSLVWSALGRLSVFLIMNMRPLAVSFKTKIAH
jgi:hypothetical protein